MLYKSIVYFEGQGLPTYNFPLILKQTFLADSKEFEFLE